jgi:hypothetical protein
MLLIQVIYDTEEQHKEPLVILIIPYWSSPVSPQTLFNVSPSTLGDKFYSFNGFTDNWATTIINCG